MSSIKQQQLLYEEGLTLKAITQAYSEIAATKLSNIRVGMENNIKFASELGDIFYLLKLESQKRGLKMTPKIPGVIHILITSNNRFYANLEKPLARYFSTSTTNLNAKDPSLPSNRLVIGKTGGTFLKAMSYNLPFTELVFKEDVPNPEESQQLIKLIKQYQTILVYHSRFKTVMTQIPVISDITQSLIKPSPSTPSIRYIFEPELQKILDFFETQILDILFNQTFLESELARTAARLISMDQAESNANDYLEAQKRSLLSVKRASENAKMIEMVSALLGRAK